MKSEPHPSVRDWLDAQGPETLFFSSVTIAELLFGIRALPRGSGERRPLVSTSTLQPRTASQRPF
ncbi:hypothetical protein [Bradyrhizobium sp. 197]|uniref:hypothetical protein n=1 Tax=unclassified Bradyrhizobium TaxID=2631580 RepID=UPI0031F64D8F